MEKKRKQTVLLLGATVLNIVVSVVVNMLLTRYLGKNDFGNYSYIINIFTFSQIFFLFGFFHSGSRLIALLNSEYEVRKFYGVELIILIFLYALMSILIFLFSLYFVFSENNNYVFNSILLVLPFGWVYLLTNYYEILFQGSNDIKYLAKVRCFPRIIFLILFIIYIIYIETVKLDWAILLYFLSYAVVYIYILLKIKPVFKDFKDIYNNIWKANVDYGFDIYLGTLFSVGTSQFTGLLISFMGDSNIEVGYFNIANQICLPLTLIPNIISTVYFKQFATSKYINKSLFKIITVISVFSFIILFVFSKTIIIFIYGIDYVAAADILLFLSIGALLYGMSDFFSRFLLAKGRGKELRNSAFLIGVILSILNVILIKYCNAIGAAYARILSGFAYMLLMCYYYKKITNED